ncbi:hypothetical protein Peur_034238 [Populus x canadensis]
MHRHLNLIKSESKMVKSQNRNKVICSGMDINVMEKGIISPRQLEQQPPVDSRMEAKACWELERPFFS